MFIVLKTYQMFTYLISAYKGDYKMTICFLKSDSYKKTVIFNGFLTYFKIGIFLLFLSQNVWQIIIYYVGSTQKCFITSEKTY